MRWVVVTPPLRAKPTTLALLLALTTYPALSCDDGPFGWACADEVAHQLQAFGFRGLRAQDIATPLRKLATDGDESVLRYVERRDSACGVWMYRITPAGQAHVGQAMLWARGSCPRPL